MVEHRRPLQGDAALVTGASRGIGRATAKRLARDGAFVLAHYGSSEAEARSLVAEIEAEGGKAVALQADLRVPSAIAALFEAADQELAQRGLSLGVVVNNAGVAIFASLEDTTEAVLDEQIAVNVKAAFLVAQAAAKRLGDGGRIINLSSVVARAYLPAIPAYAATKGFTDTLTLHLAGELGPRGIRVNAVAPGAIDTDMSAWLRSSEGEATARSIQALQRVGRPEDIADAIAMLAGPDARWVTGRVLEVSGGTKL